MLSVDQRQAVQVGLQQCAFWQLARHKRRQRADSVVAAPAHDVVGGDIARVLQAGGLHQLLQRVQGLLVKVVHPLGLVGHHQRLLAQRVLGGDAGGALAGVAVLGLDAAQREHEAARAVAPVGAQRHQAGNVKGTHHLARRADADALAQPHAAQCVVHQQQALLQW